MVSVGCEMLQYDTPNDQLVERGLISHFQMTTPNHISYSHERVYSQLGGAKLIAHNNLLNPFGIDSLEELVPVAKKIDSLSPIHVVEHFTSLRKDNGEKCGIHWDANFIELEKKRKIFSRIKHWASCFSSQVMLENVMVTHDVKPYFDLLLETREETGVGIVCDAPHFFVSCQSAGMTQAETFTLARELSPLQIHIGSVSISNGLLNDNHATLAPWMPRWVAKMFPKAEYVTLEQSDRMPFSQLEKLLLMLQNPCSAEIPSALLVKNGISEIDFNSELLSSTSRNQGLPKETNTSPFFLQQPELRTAIDLYEYFWAFVCPLESVRIYAKDVSVKEIMPLLATVIKRALLSATWWNNEQDEPIQIEVLSPHMDIIYSRFLSKSLVLKEHRFQNNVKEYRFQASCGHWLRLVAPIIFQPV